MRIYSYPGYTFEYIRKFRISVGYTESIGFPILRENSNIQIFLKGLQK